MKQVIVMLFVVLLCWFCSCKRPISKSNDFPASDLGHIDVILDSATWHAVRNDSFMQKEFGVLNVDTTFYSGKPSYDLYLLGNYNFLHLSLAKGFWQNQQKGGAIVFQSQKAGQTEYLMKNWKELYSDSLSAHTFKGKDFELGEITAWHKRDSISLTDPTMAAYLTSYSAAAYKNWGITDSIVNSGLAMKQFMSDWGGKSLEERLFNSISELYVTINQREYKEVKSALMSVGYSGNNDKLTHAKNPTVYFNIAEENTVPKFSKVKFKLNRASPVKEIKFSQNAKMEISGLEAWFIFK